MKAEFDITLTSQDMYRFSMYHTYSGFSGWFSIVIAVLCFVAAIMTKGEVTMLYTVLYIAFGVIFLVYMPCNLYLRSKRQFLMSDALKHALHYQIDENGIHTSQNDQTADLPWEQIYKLVSTKTAVLIYSSRIHAYILPKEQITGQYENICKMAEEHLPSYRLKMR